MDWFSRNIFPPPDAIPPLNEWEVGDFVAIGILCLLLGIGFYFGVIKRFKRTRSRLPLWKLILNQPFMAVVVILSSLCIVFLPLWLFLVGKAMITRLPFDFVQPSPARAVEEFRIVRKKLHFCQIKEIQFEYPHLKGKVTYLNENDVPVSEEFFYLRPEFLVIKDSVRGEGWTTHIPFQRIRKARFETLPYVEIESWPRRFPLNAIPEIKVEVEHSKYTRPVIHSTHAIGSLYFYGKESGG